MNNHADFSDLLFTGDKSEPFLYPRRLPFDDLQYQRDDQLYYCMSYQNVQSILPLDSQLDLEIEKLWTAQTPYSMIDTSRNTGANTLVDQLDLIDVDFYLETKKREESGEERAILAREACQKKADMKVDLAPPDEELKMEDDGLMESSDCSGSVDSEFCLISSKSRPESNLNGIPGKNKKRPRKQDYASKNKFFVDFSGKLKKLRADVVLKVILRLMRKHYLEEFKKTTQYVQKRKQVKIKYFKDQMATYIEQLYSELDEKYQQKVSEEDLSLYLGSLFYPKIMHKIHKNPKQRKLVDNYHNTLYSFSILQLLKESKRLPFRILMRNFIALRKQDLIDSNQTFKKALDDYEAGFKFFEHILFDI